MGYNRDYYLKRREHFLKQSKEFRSSHKEYYNNYNKNYQNEHKEEIKKQRKIYYQKNRDRILKQKSEYGKRKTMEKHQQAGYVPVGKRKFYTEANKIIIKYYPYLTGNEIKSKYPEIFKNTSADKISARAIRLGVKQSKEKIVRLKEISKMRFLDKPKTELHRKKLSKAQKLNWQDEEYAKEQIKSIFNKPTRPERIVNQICRLNNLFFNYVGDGKLWVKGKNPDFINKKDNKIIEVNGEHWHQDRSRDRRKLYAYSISGFKTLTIWQRKLYSNPQKITEKIINFSLNS